MALDDSDIKLLQEPFMLAPQVFPHDHGCVMVWIREQTFAHYYAFSSDHVHKYFNICSSNVLNLNLIMD